MNIETNSISELIKDYLRIRSTVGEDSICSSINLLQLW